MKADSKPIDDDLLITPEDAFRKAQLCVLGTRAFFKSHGLDYGHFIRHGIKLSLLREHGLTDDPDIVKAIAAARSNAVAAKNRAVGEARLAAARERYRASKDHEHHPTPWSASSSTKRERATVETPRHTASPVE